MKFNRRTYQDNLLKKLYQEMLLPRLIEEKMLILLRQNKISKWFSGIGQEAISVGITQAIEGEDYIFPLHRNLGVFTSRHVPLANLFAQWQGKTDGYTKGRDRSFHFGLKSHHIIGMISHLGPQNGVAAGVALARKLKKEKKIVVVFNGDGGVSEGDFHEAINTAAVWDLPVLFVIENNKYGLSTPTAEQYRCKHLVDKAVGYGIEGVRVDGNNVLDVYDAVVSITNRMRHEHRPVLLECDTFRMRGHEEASGVQYVPKKLIETWSKKDPVKSYESFLLATGVLSEMEQKQQHRSCKDQIEKGLDKAFDSPFPNVSTEEEEKDVYAPFQQRVVAPTQNVTSPKRLVDAITDALHQSMNRYPNMLLMGQDIADYGGVFKVTEGFVDDFGKERVRNTPICESAIIGMGLGLAIQNMKAVVEMQFADFVTEGFTQIINNLAKTHWRWGQCADVVVRMPTGAGIGAGPFHSQSNEAWFFHTPGLKVVYPSNPYDAKGLLNATIEDPNPYLFFEHKKLYRSIKTDIPDEYYTIAIGKARTVQEGQDMVIITYGMGVHWAQEATRHITDSSIAILDLRTLLPWDKQAVSQIVEQTSRVLVLHEDTLTGGIGAEIAAWIGEHCFQYLDAPVVRVASLDTPVPFADKLEQNFLPKARLVTSIQHLLQY